MSTEHFRNGQSYEREGRAGRERLCTGPGHDEPTWLPATEKYFYQHKSGAQVGQFQSRCRLCFNWNRLKSPGISGWVPYKDAYPFVYEAVARVGIMEAARRTGLSRSTLHKFLHGQHIHMQKRTLRVIMLEVISMRRKGEVRHRNSIRTGAYLRGQVEKTPTRQHHFNGWHNDSEGERKKRARRGGLAQAGSCDPGEGPLLGGVSSVQSGLDNLTDNN